jgi:hypothetical protein
MAIDVQCKINVLIKDMSSSRYAQKTTSPAATGRVLSGQSPAGTAGHCRKRVVPGNIKPEQLHPQTAPAISTSPFHYPSSTDPRTSPPTPHRTSLDAILSHSIPHNGSQSCYRLCKSTNYPAIRPPRVLCIQCCIITTCPLYSTTARVQNVPSAVLCLS